MLKERLLQLFFDENVREEKIQKALTVADKYHNCTKVGETVYKTIERI